jgi:hypothetical protein
MPMHITLQVLLYFCVDIPSSELFRIKMLLSQTVIGMLKILTVFVS